MPTQKTSQQNDGTFSDNNDRFGSRGNNSTKNTDQSSTTQKDGDSRLNNRDNGDMSGKAAPTRTMNDSDSVKSPNRSDQDQSTRR